MACIQAIVLMPQSPFHVVATRFSGGACSSSWSTETVQEERQALESDSGTDGIAAEEMLCNGLLLLDGDRT
jgi:hypothetical protein